jgi:RNA polymerase sigma-70 factor (ECF subfamily)
LWAGAELEASLHDQASNDASPEQRAELALVDRALSRMPLKLRTPWVLRHVLGERLEDVAAACNCSLATVKRRLAEAETVVADHLGEEVAR